MKESIEHKDTFSIRNGHPSDHSRIYAVMEDWWGGRDLRNMLLMPFFIHFRDTIFIAEKDSELVGFLVGFYSQSFCDEAYIHLVGVHPDMRGQGVGRSLYECFFEACEKNKRKIVRACTSPVNKASIEFHKSLGFQIEAGEDEIDGVPVTLNWHRPNDPKVLFRKVL